MLWRSSFLLFKEGLMSSLYWFAGLWCLFVVVWVYFDYRNNWSVVKK
jgi:hypothetical protein